MLPSRSRNENISGTSGQRSSSSTSTPASVMAACSASASVVTKRMPVSIPDGSESDAATIATETSRAGGATSIQRNPGASSASMRGSKPSGSTKKATARS